MNKTPLSIEEKLLVHGRKPRICAQQQRIPYDSEDDCSSWLPNNLGWRNQCTRGTFLKFFLHSISLFVLMIEDVTFCQKNMWIEDLGWRWVTLIQGLWQRLTFWTNAVFNFRSIFGFGVMGGLSSTQTGAQESPLVVPVHFAYRLIIVVIQNMVA